MTSCKTKVAPEAVLLVGAAKIRDGGGLHPLRRVLHDLGLIHGRGEGSHRLRQSSHEESQDTLKEAALVADVFLG